MACADNGMSEMGCRGGRRWIKVRCFVAVERKAEAGTDVMYLGLDRGNCSFLLAKRDMRIQVL